MASASMWKRKRHPFIVHVDDWSINQKHEACKVIRRAMKGVGDAKEERKEESGMLMVIRRAGSSLEQDMAKSVYPDAPIWINYD